MSLRLIHGGGGADNEIVVELHFNADASAQIGELEAYYKKSPEQLALYGYRILMSLMQHETEKGKKQSIFIGSDFQDQNMFKLASPDQI